MSSHDNHLLKRSQIKTLGFITQHQFHNALTTAYCMVSHWCLGLSSSFLNGLGEPSFGLSYRNVPTFAEIKQMRWDINETVILIIYQKTNQGHLRSFYIESMGGSIPYLLCWVLENDILFKCLFVYSMLWSTNESTKQFGPFFSSTL